MPNDVRSVVYGTQYANHCKGPGAIVSLPIHSFNHALHVSQCPRDLSAMQAQCTCVRALA